MSRSIFCAEKMCSVLKRTNAVFCKWAERSSLDLVSRPNDEGWNRLRHQISARPRPPHRITQAQTPARLDLDKPRPWRAPSPSPLPRRLSPPRRCPSPRRRSRPCRCPAPFSAGKSLRLSAAAASRSARARSFVARAGGEVRRDLMFDFFWGGIGASVRVGIDARPRVCVRRGTCRWSGTRRRTSRRRPCSTRGSSRYGGNPVTTCTATLRHARTRGSVIRHRGLIGPGKNGVIGQRKKCEIINFFLQSS